MKKKKLKKKWKFVVTFLILPCIAIIMLYGGLYLYAWLTPKLNIDRASNYYFYDKDSNIMDGGSNKDWVSIENISHHLINATLAVEDKNFYNHIGFDYLRIVKSLYINFSTGEKRQGASTITQQYARNLFLTFDKKWGRKLEEAWITIQLESHYSKNRILEGYLNTINYGGIFGIENASKFYFNKSAKDLTLSEASILAGIPKNPSYYSPLSNEEAAKTRQWVILKSMVNNDYINDNEMDIAYQESLSYYGKEQADKINTLMYYQDAVIEELKNIKTIPASFLTTGGLKIYTNFDVSAQKLLDEAIKDKFINVTQMQIASVVMDPNNGKILALAGGTNYSQTQYNRVISSKRQVGSTLKPFLYYSALENGFTASTTFTSEKTTFAFSENKTYSPSNYGENYGNKPISMAAALAYSDNIYAVKTHLFLGEETLVDIAKRTGISSNLSPVPSLALGTSEINMIEMMKSYASLANEGYKVNPHVIRKIEDTHGNVLYEANTIKENILNRSIVYILNEMMNNCYATEFIDYNYPTCISMASQLTRKYAIKTGTTDTDSLIFGYTPNLVMGIWAGHDDNRKIETEEQGIVKNVWSHVMEHYLKEQEKTWYAMPRNVVGVLIDPVSGKLATDKTKNKRLVYYIKGTEPYADSDNLDTEIPTIKEQ